MVISRAAAEHDLAHDAPPSRDELVPPQDAGGLGRIKELCGLSADIPHDAVGEAMDLAVGVQGCLIDAAPVFAEAAVRDQYAVRLEVRERAALLPIVDGERRG
jgi:hypothetical protein